MKQVPGSPTGLMRSDDECRSQIETWLQLNHGNFVTEFGLVRVGRFTGLVFLNRASNDESELLRRLRWSEQMSPAMTLYSTVLPLSS